MSVLCLDNEAWAQGKDNNEQTRSALITAPGTDQTKFVPGSTVPSFSSFQFFKLGSILVRPSSVISYTYESNLFAQYGGTDPDHSIIIEPTIEAMLPVGANGIRLDYSARYRKYSNYEVSDKMEHTFNLDSQIDFSPIMSLAVRNHFALSSLDSREYVPGREVIFADSRFRRNNIEGQLNWSLNGSTDLGLNLGWNHIKFLDIVDASRRPFYDYDQYGYGGFFRRAVSQRTALFINGSYNRTPTADPRGIADSRGIEAVAGVESELTPLISGQFSVGMRRDRFPNAPTQNHTGAVFRGNLTKEISERIRLSLALSRATNPSNFQNNAYFLSQGIGLIYIHEFSPNLVISLSPGYQRNSYPQLLGIESYIPASVVGREKRRDTLVDFAAAARYRCNSWAAIDFRFDFMHRNSVIPEYAFDNYRAGVSLLLGSSGITMGRSPY